MCPMAETQSARSTMKHIQKHANISILDQVLHKHEVNNFTEEISLHGSTPMKQGILGKYVESFECLLGKISFQRKQNFSGKNMLRLISISDVSHQLEGSFSDKSLI